MQKQRLPLAYGGSWQNMKPNEAIGVGMLVGEHLHIVNAHNFSGEVIETVPFSLMRNNLYPLKDNLIKAGEFSLHMQSREIVCGTSPRQLRQVSKPLRFVANALGTAPYVFYTVEQVTFNEGYEYCFPAAHPETGQIMHYLVWSEDGLYHTEGGRADGARTRAWDEGIDGSIPDQLFVKFTPVNFNVPLS